MLAGIKKLDMHPPGSEGRRNYETVGVSSPDGEYLPFVAPIVTEGRPEEWLNTVEEAMFAATKRHLYRVICTPLPCLEAAFTVEKLISLGNALALHLKH